MLREEVQQLTGAPHSRGGGRVGRRWGRTKGKIGFHGGKVVVPRPRVCSGGREVPLPTWQAEACNPDQTSYSTRIMMQRGIYL
jgi:putative transposase